MACIFYYKPCCENHIPTGTKKHGIAGGFFSVWFERFRERKYPWRYSGGGICGHECRAMDFKDKGRKNILPTFVLFYVFMLLFHT